jgi:cytochrome c oxidase subunit I+III
LGGFSVRQWLFTTNHRMIGILYLVTSLYFMLLGGALGLLIRLQLWGPNSGILGAGQFNQAVTMHGLLMVLWFLSPMAFGFANYIVPLQIGARDLAFPRLNAMSYWFYLFGGLVAAAGFFLPGGAADVGWTFYSPLTSARFSPGLGVTLAGAGLLMLVASVTMSTVNFLVTILRMRGPGISLGRMPLFTWSILFTVAMMWFAFPPLLAALLMLVSDRLLGTLYFVSPEGGAILWNHLFWFFGHPEVYIVLMPALGVVGDIIAVFSRRPLYARQAIIGSMLVAVILSFIVWVHHMFITGIDPGLRKFMTITTESISIPFGIIILSFILTLFRGRVRLTTPMLFALGSIALFIVGGITGVFNSSVALDYNLRGTYWVVGHFHYTLVGGAVLGLVAGLYYWFPRMAGRMYSEALGRLHFTTSIIGFNLLYFPMFYLIDMPRRVYTYDAGSGWEALNQVATIGAFIFGLSQLVMLYNLMRSLRVGPPAVGNPWGAGGLEWMPAPTHTPPGLMVNGGGLPQGHEEHLLSPWPLLMGAATAIFFLGLGLGPLVLGLGVALGLLSLAGWMRQDLRGEFRVEEGAVEPWPYGGVPRLKLGVWAFLASEAVLFGALISAYIFIRLNSPSWPPGIQLHDLRLGGVNTIILLTSSFTMAAALHSIRGGSPGGLIAGLLSTFLLGLLFLANKAVEWSELFHRGFTFGSGLPASTFYLTTGVHGAHVLAGLIAILYLLIKAFRGGFGPAKHEAVEYVGLYWHFVDIVWVFLFPLFYLL